MSTMADSTASGCFATMKSFCNVSARKDLTTAERMGRGLSWCPFKERRRLHCDRHFEKYSKVRFPSWYWGMSCLAGSGQQLGDKKTNRGNKNQLNKNKNERTWIRSEPMKGSWASRIPTPERVCAMTKSQTLEREPTD